jgi:hypothetical protein
MRVREMENNVGAKARITISRTRIHVLLKQRKLQGTIE